jgi:hypothetical protein
LERPIFRRLRDLAGTLWYDARAMNNPVTIAIFTAVSLVVLTFSIFAASWLNRRNDERLHEALRQEMNARFDGLTAKIRKASRSSNA